MRKIMTNAAAETLSSSVIVAMYPTPIPPPDRPASRRLP